MVAREALLRGCPLTGMPCLAGDPDSETAQVQEAVRHPARALFALFRNLVVR
jgi:hypothetical protein